MLSCLQEKRKYFWSVNFPNILNYSGPEGITSWREDSIGGRPVFLGWGWTWSLQTGGKLPGALPSLAKWQELLSAQSFTFSAADTLKDCFSFLLLQNIQMIGQGRSQANEMFFLCSPVTGWIPCGGQTRRAEILWISLKSLFPAGCREACVA